MLAVSSCSKKISFQTSTAVPAAQGVVKYKKDGNNNYRIEVDIKNLAAPKRLEPPKSTYVVWIETDANGTKNIGQLKTSSGIFTSTLKASLTTVSAFKPAFLFITAEENGDIQYPGYQVVLRTNRF
ncbi:hypothetical protein EXU57_03790 [Segetibacter sp. 3557_3]|nr:hypothetical protein EXU57_03790 [Segetibacter sp. 3557_3]